MYTHIQDEDCTINVINGKSKTHSFLLCCSPCHFCFICYFSTATWRQRITVIIFVELYDIFTSFFLWVHSIKWDNHFFYFSPSRTPSGTVGSPRSQRSVAMCRIIQDFGTNILHCTPLLKLLQDSSSFSSFGREVSVG